MEQKVRVVVKAESDASVDEATEYATRVLEEQECTVVDTSKRMFTFGEAEGRITVEEGKTIDVDAIRSQPSVGSVRVEAVQQRP